MQHFTEIRDWNELEGASDARIPSIVASFVQPSLKNKRPLDFSFPAKHLGGTRAQKAGENAHLRLVVAQASAGSADTLPQEGTLQPSVAGRFGLL